MLKHRASEGPAHGPQFIKRRLTPTIGAGQPSPPSLRRTDENRSREQDDPKHPEEAWEVDVSQYSQKQQYEGREGGTDGNGRFRFRQRCFRDGEPRAALRVTNL